MKGTVRSDDVTKVLAALRTVDKGLMDEWRTQARTQMIEPWAKELARQAPAGSKGAAAGRSIQAAKSARPALYAGKGSWRGWQPFWATNYGMAHSKVHTYIRRNRKNGGRHVVRRRSGTWAPEHRGRHGYWFEPYWERNIDRQRKRVVDLADAYLRRVL